MTDLRYTIKPSSFNKKYIHIQRKTSFLLPDHICDNVIWLAT